GALRPHRPRAVLPPADDENLAGLLRVRARTHRARGRWVDRAQPRRQAPRAYLHVELRPRPLVVRRAHVVARGRGAVLPALARRAPPRRAPARSLAGALARRRGAARAARALAGESLRELGGRAQVRDGRRLDRRRVSAR